MKKTGLKMLLLLLIVGNLCIADEAQVRSFVEKYQLACDGGKIEVTVNTQSDDFIYYFATRECPHEGKHNCNQPVLAVPSENKFFVGTYMNMQRLKNDVDDPRAISEFLSSILGTKIKLTLESRTEHYEIWTVAQETGYGTVRQTGYRFEKYHFLLGRSYDMDEDPRQTRIREFPWGQYPSIGPKEAPHKLAIFIDFECPSCAKFEKKLLPLLNERDDIFTTFFQYPLVTIHPWAFKGACGAMCYNNIGGDLYFEFLEDIYEQRADLDLESIDYAVFGFGDQRNLREHLLGCYMKPSNIQNVLEQLEFAFRQDIRFTPGIYYDGVHMLASDFLDVLEKNGN